MSVCRRFYWLKLKRDFFTDKRIKKLRKIAGGDTYTIIYLKMQLLSLQDEGVLYFDNVEETFEEEIALQIDEDVDDVKITIGYLISNGLLKQLSQNEYELVEAKKCIGSESDSKDRVSLHRQRKAIRDSIKLKYVQVLSKEMIRTLTDGETHFIDNKRYGGNGEYVYDLAMCKCENCGETNTKKFVIHHANGYSNDLEDLYLLCPKCHRNVEVGNIKKLVHHRRNYEKDLLEYEENDVTCNTSVTKCNIEKEKEKEIEIDNKYNVEDILAYLNQKLKTNYKTTTKATISKIKARMNEGFSLDDFKTVIDKKYDEWIGTDMEIYLRPDTLFGTKFESYLNQKVISKKESAIEKLQREIKEAEEESEL